MITPVSSDTIEITHLNHVKIRFQAQGISVIYSCHFKHNVKYSIMLFKI